MLRIEIEEFRSSQPLDLGKEEVNYLLENHKSHLELIPSNGKYIIKARSYVGFVQLQDKILYLKPKIADENLLYILSFVSECFQPEDDIKFDRDTSHSILEIMVIILIQWINQVLKKGLFRRYINKIDKIPGVRGKIIPARNLYYFDKLVCSFNDLSYSIYENMILKATLRLILNFNINTYLKDEAKILIKRLSDINDMELTDHCFSSFRYSRLNINYLRIIKLCYLIYKNLSIFHCTGNVEFQSFMINMNDIFESFIRKYLIQAFPSESISKRRKTNWATGPNMNLFPAIEPDIVIDNKLIIDTKYYRDILGSNNKFHSHNLYQILTYATAYNLPGLLLYPEFKTSYNEVYTVSDKAIYIKTINLGKSRSELFNDLKNFRDQINMIIN